MGTALPITVVTVLCALVPSLANAQRFPFERSFPSAGVTMIDVSTLRGKIEIVAADADRILVAGEVTVRMGWNVPANAIELAQKVANTPPVERENEVVRLRPPSDGDTQRAVTISYRVRVPAGTHVRTDTDSGGTTIHGISGSVDVRTQSAAIDLSSLGGSANVVTGSGAVRVRGAAGPLNVMTSSSAITATDLGAALKVRTQSGQVDAALSGSGDVDVETGSSAILLRGLRGGLTARTQSGRLSVQGAPGRQWSATTGSSSVSLDIDTNDGFSIDASSRSGDIETQGARVQGSIAKHAVKGAVDGGGPLLRISTGSGAIRIRVI